MKVLVTGGSGFIGSHVVERALAAGHDVRVLARRSSEISHLRDLGVELAWGDLRDAGTLVPALRGIDVVYHQAALVGDWGRWRDYSGVAIDGTQRLLEAAIRCDVPRLVHMSSASVYGLRRIRGRLVTEDLPLPRRPWRWDYYGRAKIESERVVRHHHRAGHIGVTILRPTTVYGPRDRSVLPRLAALLRSRRLTIVGTGSNRIHLIYVGDVAEAAFRAATEPRAVGRTYHLDGRREITQRQFMNAVADLVKAPRPRRRLPLHLSYGLGFLQEAWGHALRRPTPPTRTRYLVALSGGEAHFDTTRAEQELGWKPQTPIQAGLERTAHWWRSAVRRELSLSEFAQCS